MNLTKDTFIYGIPSVLRGLISFLLLPFFTSELSPEEYGIFTIFLLFNSFCFIVFNFGLANSIAPLYFNKGLDKSDVVSNSFFLSIICSTGLFLFTLFFGKYILFVIGIEVSFYKLLLFFSFSTIIKIISIPFDSILKFESRSTVYSYVSVFSIIINFSISSILILNYNYSIEGFIIGAVSGDLVFFIMGFIFSNHNLKLKLDHNLIKRLLKIGIPMMPSGLIMYLFNEHYRLIVEKTGGIETLGILTVTLSICTVIYVPFNAFRIAWFPYFMSFKEKSEEFKKIFESLRSKFLIISGTLCSLFILLYEKFIDLMIPKEFIVETDLVIGIAFSQLLFSFTNLFYPIFYFVENLRYILYAQLIAAIVGIPITFFLLKNYDLQFLGYAYLICNFSLLSLVFFFSSWLQRKNKMVLSINLLSKDNLKHLSFFIFFAITMSNNFINGMYDNMKHITLFGILTIYFLICDNKYSLTNFYGKKV